MPILKFDVPGAVVPYVRMTRRSKFISQRAQRYLAWKQEWGFRVNEVMANMGWKMAPAKVSISVRIDYLVELPRKTTFDLDNVVKGVLDASQRIVFPDDREVDHIEAHRLWIGDSLRRVLFEVSWDE